MARVITIGETMAALSPCQAGALRYVGDYQMRIAGAESNVAVGLAKLEIESAWISRLGEDELGCFVRNQIRSEGVDCGNVVFDPEHSTGLLLKETGTLETKVYYYRE
ncbi:MAG: PfkB family carbohydrate kinase, partial [[Clostridium] leptum]